MSLTSILIGLLAAAAQPGAGGSDIAVLGAHFYARDARQGDAGFRQTTEIPYRVGTSCYGWILQVPPEQRSVTIREVYELPAPARNWGGEDPAQNIAVARDQASAVTEFEAPLGEGVINHDWCVAEGDPLGRHRIRVYHGERLLHDFSFTVVAETN